MNNEIKTDIPVNINLKFGDEDIQIKTKFTLVITKDKEKGNAIFAGKK